MATKTIRLKGKTKYFRPYYIDREYEDPDNGRGGNYSIQIELDDESVQTFNTLGAKAKLKDGNVAKFSRYEYANYGKGPEALGPPKYSGFDESQLIGNGSDATVTIDVYPYTFKNKSSFAIRLVAVHIDNLIEYQRPVGTDADDNTPPVH